MTKSEIVQVIEAIMEKERADGCNGCVFWSKDEWEMPCRECQRNKKDYWRAKDERICED